MSVEWKEPFEIGIHVYNEEDVLNKVAEEMRKLDGKEVVNVCVAVRKGGDQVIKLAEQQLVLHRKPNTLISLSLAFQGLEEVPAVVCELVSLNGLYIGGNKLKTLPAQLAKLTQLKSHSTQVSQS